MSLKTASRCLPFLGCMAAAAFLSTLPISGASAEQVMRVGMTAADIPTTGGIPNNGGEGFRFLGYPAFDALVNWDFKHTDQTADVTPGLATSWEIDEVDHTRWIFHLRQGVKFHDGTDFNADAVLFTLGRIYDDSRRSSTRPHRRSCAPLSAWCSAGRRSMTIRS